MGVPQNGWFIREHPIKMDDWGVALFQETTKYIQVYHISPPFVISQPSPTHFLIYLAGSKRDHVLECDGSSMASHGIWIFGKYLVGGCIPTPLKNDGVRQLG